MRNTFFININLKESNKNIRFINKEDSCKDICDII